MIRGPSRGLGTFRCRCCRWILPLLLVTLPLLFGSLVVVVTAASATAAADQSTPAGNYISSSSRADPPATVSIFHHQLPANMVAAAASQSLPAAAAAATSRPLAGGPRLRRLQTGSAVQGEQQQWQQQRDGGRIDPATLEQKQSLHPKFPQRHRQRHRTGLEFLL
jgi:hypothetical protein